MYVYGSMYMPVYLCVDYLVIYTQLITYNWYSYNWYACTDIYGCRHMNTCMWLQVYDQTYDYSYMTTCIWMCPYMITRIWLQTYDYLLYDTIIWYTHMITCIWLQTYDDLVYDTHIWDTHVMITYLTTRWKIALWRCQTSKSKLFWRMVGALPNNRRIATA